ncbi:MAG: DUF1854 domain-containing protein [Phycisphaerae bacterium]|nr:DUF1854 domain-containing protein [Gemmatimonadaceae bacterium]
MTEELLVGSPGDERLDTGDDQGVVLHNTGDGRLFVLVDDELVAVELRQCFPWSQPTRYLSLWGGAGNDEREMALVDDPAQLSPESRRALEAALANAGFVLQVMRVLSVEEEVEIRHWRVITRHGARSFQTHLDEWPRALPDGALLIRDVAGDLYRLPPKQELDKVSREVLWAFID